MDEVSLNKLKQEKSVKSETSNLQCTFDVSNYYEVEMLIKSKSLQHRDFFYFEKPTLNVTLAQRFLYAVPDLARILMNLGLENKADLNTATSSLEYIIDILVKDDSQTLQDYQHLLRESCLVDLMMEVLIKFFNSKKIDKVIIPYMLKLA